MVHASTSGRVGKFEPCFVISIVCVEECLLWQMYFRRTIY